jgi:hypothetical protein
VEFVTITQFDDLDSVRGFAGEDYTKAVIAHGAAELLTRYDDRSAHYETILTPEDVRAAAAERATE